MSEALAGQLLILPYLGNCLIEQLPSAYLAVQRRSGYGRAAQFQTQWLSDYYAALQLPTWKLPLRLLFAFCAHLPSALEEAPG